MKVLVRVSYFNVTAKCMYAHETRDSPVISFVRQLVRQPLSLPSNILSILRAKILLYDM